MPSTEVAGSIIQEDSRDKCNRRLCADLPLSLSSTSSPLLQLLQEDTYEHHYDHAIKDSTRNQFKDSIQSSHARGRDAYIKTVRYQLSSVCDALSSLRENTTTNSKCSKLLLELTFPLKYAFFDLKRGIEALVKAFHTHAFIKFLMNFI
ncbi:hypothetical protein Avbf_01201 [Armadillidium vulgare]|nr:hypothetical protein Avbf_01201 [Armadillidium vulgare]